MQSLLTVNNNVSLLSVTISPSTFLASLTLLLVFLALYLPPLRFRSGRSTSPATNKGNHNYKYDYDYDYNYNYKPVYDHRGRDNAKSHGSRFASYFNNTWYPRWISNRAPDPSIELRNHPPLIADTVAIEDDRRRSRSGSRQVVRASRRTSKSGQKERDRRDEPYVDWTRNALQPPRSPGRLSSRFRIGQSLAAAVRLPLDPQRLSEIRYRGGPERDGKFDGLRGWLQPTGLEAPRKR